MEREGRDRGKKAHSCTLIDRSGKRGGSPVASRGSISRRRRRSNDLSLSSSWNRSVVAEQRETATDLSLPRVNGELSLLPDLRHNIFQQFHDAPSSTLARNRINERRARGMHHRSTRNSFRIRQARTRACRSIRWRTCSLSSNRITRRNDFNRPFVVDEKRSRSGSDEGGSMRRKERNIEAPYSFCVSTSCTEIK